MEIIKQEKFYQIYQWIQSRTDLKQIAKTENISYDVLISIYFLKVKDETKKSYRFHQSPQQMAFYYSRYMKGESMVQISESIDLSPCLLARIILKIHFQALLEEKEILNNNNTSNSNNNNSNSPSSRNIFPSENVSKNWITKCLNNPNIIEDERLRKEIEDCILADDSYSPLMEKFRNRIGVEYEFLLHERLNNLGILFLSEEETRQHGYPKTPDATLITPILVGSYPVTWIESKATFGDPESHQDYAQRQFRPYYNRHGPGLVIYWFGFVEELKEQALKEGYLVMHDFPTEILKLKLEDNLLQTDQKPQFDLIKSSSIQMEFNVNKQFLNVLGDKKKT